MKVRAKLSGLFELLPISQNRQEEIEVAGDSLEDLLEHLFSKMEPRSKKFVFDDRGGISSNLLVSINGSLFTGPNRLCQSIKENDYIELYLFSTG